jgi:hypothetical protein
VLLTIREKKYSSKRGNKKHARKREGEEGTRCWKQFIEQNKNFLVRFRRRDCCLSVGDVLYMLYVVFCFVTHPTFILLYMSRLSSAHILPFTLLYYILLTSYVWDFNIEELMMMKNENRLVFFYYYCVVLCDEDRKTVQRTLFQLFFSCWVCDLWKEAWKILQKKMKKRI